MANSLHDITNAWGKWMDKQYDGGGVKFTASTNYSAHDELDDYHDKQVVTDQQPIVYDPNAPAPTPGSMNLVTSDYVNNTSVQQSHTFTQSETTEQSFTWSITEDLSVGVEVSISAEVPLVAEVGTKVTTNLSVSSSQGQTVSNTQTWEVSEPIICPPYKTVHASMVVATQAYDINWSGTCILTGSVAIWFNDKTKLPSSNDSHHLFFVKIQQVFDDCRDHNLISLSGYTIGSSSVSAMSSGVFRGGQGVSVSIRVDESSINGSSAAQAKSADNSYEIPLDVVPS